MSKFGYKFNHYLKRCWVNIYQKFDDPTNYEGEEELEQVFEDIDKHIACILHLVCLTPKISEESQRHNLFQTRGIVI